jgi:hypothetical protein
MSAILARIARPAIPPAAPLLCCPAHPRMHRCARPSCCCQPGRRPRPGPAGRPGRSRCWRASACGWRRVVSRGPGHLAEMAARAAARPRAAGRPRRRRHALRGRRRPAGRPGREGLLGVVPLGTGNDFVKSAGLPRDWRAACRALAAGCTPRRVDAGRVNGRWFINGVGFGFDAAIARATLRYKWLPGPAGLCRGAGRRLGPAPAAPGLPLRWDGGEDRARGHAGRRLQRPIRGRAVQAGAPRGARRRPARPRLGRRAGPVAGAAPRAQRHPRHATSACRDPPGAQPLAGDRQRHARCRRRPTASCSAPTLTRLSIELAPGAVWA